MTTTVTITGTGIPIPSPDRAGAGVLVRSGGLALQFDAGRSTVQRLAGCGLLPRDLDAVFVTHHHHNDHLSGLQDVVLTRWMVLGRDAPALPIVAPAGPVTDFLARLLDCWDHDIDVRNEHAGETSRPAYDVVGFDVGDSIAPVWSSGDVSVSAGRVRHEPVDPAVGYRIETPDGVIAITGDTRVCDEVAVLAGGADVLVYEAMRVEAVQRYPAAVAQRLLGYHADTRLIGAQAAALGVGTLVLTHLLPPPASDDDRQAFIDDIRSGGYQGEVIVADDLTTVTLRANGSASS